MAHVCTRVQAAYVTTRRLAAFSASPSSSLWRMQVVTLRVFGCSPLAPDSGVVNGRGDGTGLGSTGGLHTGVWGCGVQGSGVPGTPGVACAAAGRGTDLVVGGLPDGTAQDMVMPSGGEEVASAQSGGWGG